MGSEMCIRDRVCTIVMDTVNRYQVCTYELRVSVVSHWRATIVVPSCYCYDAVVDAMYDGRRVQV